MKNSSMFQSHTYWLPILFACCLLSFSGCGGENYAPVSGRVTLGGQPVANVTIVFTPKRQGDNHFPGPFSTAITDSDGQFSLVTRDKSKGAVPGLHAVGVRHTEDLQAELSFYHEQMAIVDTEEDPRSAKAELQKKIKETREKLASRPKFNEGDEYSFEVPPEGTTAANFELNEPK